MHQFAAPIASLFAHPQAAEHILHFLVTTQVGRRVDGDDRERERTRRSDEWGMEEAAREEEAVGDEDGDERRMMEEGDRLTYRWPEPDYHYKGD